MAICHSKSYIWEKVCPNLDCSSTSFNNDFSRVSDYLVVKSKYVRTSSTTCILQSSLLKNNSKYIVKKQYGVNGETNRPRNPSENFDNELHALKLLIGQRGFPQLLYYSRKELVIYMSYCGETLTRQRSAQLAAAIAGHLQCFENSRSTATTFTLVIFAC